MIAIARVDRRLWLALASAGAALATGASLLAFVLLDSPAITGAGQDPSSPALGIEQAPWRIVATRAGIVERSTKADRNEFARQRPRVKQLVRDVYDALFLYPDSVRKVLKRRFDGRARRAFHAAKVGLTPGATQVRTLRRAARIGVAAHGARQGVAIVRVRLESNARGRRVRTDHRSTMWLQRRGSRWRVIAFDVAQRPRP